MLHSIKMKMKVNTIKKLISIFLIASIKNKYWVEAKILSAVSIGDI